MSLLTFFRSRPQVARRGPSVQESREERTNELRADLRLLDSEAELLNSTAATFRSQNMAVLKGRSVFVCQNWEQRAELESTWHAIQVRAGQIQAKRNAILSELVRLSDEREHERKQEAIGHGHA